VYEKAPDSVAATEEDLVRDGFGPKPRFECVVGEWNGQPAGFALFFYNYSTWEGKAGIYLEDLFVRPVYRGQGIGKALFRYLAGRTRQEGLGRLVWQVLDWNEPAIQFYRSLGATRQEEWQTVRLTGEALKALANND
jgi:GNAT superfamily N-acetyltransferase